MRKPFVIAILLGVHGGLLAWSGYRHFPNIDEIGHLSGGMAHITFGRFDVYCVNPPLVRTIAAVPVVLARPQYDWKGYRMLGPRARAEFAIGGDFMRHHGDRALFYFAMARWMCIPFSLLGGLVCYYWARDLFGRSAGLLSLSLWCFSPTVLANSSTILPDSAAAAIGAATCYAFWRWIKSPSWIGALVLGFVLGLAQLTKTTLLVLFIAFPAILALAYVLRRSELVQRGIIRLSCQLTTALLLAVYVINAGYGFEGFARRLDDYSFVSRFFGGEQAEEFQSGNRFEDSRLGRIPVPLPENYLRGIDYIRYEFEQGYPSYLRGEWRHGGWSYYYLYALLVKEPIGVLLLSGAALASAIVDFMRRRMSRARILDEAVVLIPALAILALVSSQTGFNHHVRYVLPVFPLVFVWIGRLRREAELTGSANHGGMSALRVIKMATPRCRSWLKNTAAGLRPVLLKWCFVTAMLGWTVVGSLSVYPHSHAYFNELAGGPKSGWRHLHNSNVDWGQDLSYLRGWLEAHPDVKEIGIAPFHWGLDLHQFGLNSFKPNRWPLPASEQASTDVKTGPQPGWYAISHCHLAGEPDESFWGRSDEEYQDDPSRSYFRELEPIDHVGYSMSIYHVTLEECNRLRRTLGLEELPRDWKRKPSSK